MFSRFSLLILCLCCAIVSTKVCRSLDIRSEVSQFDKLKNCTKIVGFLRLVLLEDVLSYPSFPKLREVTGYVLVFVTKNLYDLGHLFPNLVVIRGRHLLKGNSLIIHHNNHIRKIGLTNLLKIQRGHVQIGKCPNLCYVHTVNWTAIGTSLSKYADIAKCEKEECAPDCKGQCWAPGKCQKFYDNCHPECLGCSKPDSPKDCLVCENLKDVDTCVSKCPPNKYISEEMFTCVTKEECYSMDLPGNRWIFEKWCIPVNTCPERYEIVNTTTITCKPCEGSCTKICSGASLETKEHIDQLRGCTHIAGHLELFKITDEYAIEHLEENLGSIKEISGCLKVARSDALSSLNFFKSLQRIGGQDKQRPCNNHTVFIYENPNLRSLVDVARIESTNVSIGFHNNPELCISTIQDFAAKLGITKEDFDKIMKEEKDVSPYSNGDRATCFDLKLNVTIVDNNPTNVTLRWNPYNERNVTVLGYTVFYILASMLGKESSIDISSNLCNSNGWMSRFIDKNSIQLTQLEPFSTYVYWIKVYHIIVDYKSGVVGSTEKKTFMTVPDDPMSPSSFETIAISPTSIKVTWEPPEKTNGILSHYQLLAFVEKDDFKFVNRRNYCVYPHVTAVEEKVKPPVRNWFNRTENGVCVCEPNVFKMNDTLCFTSNAAYGLSNNDCNRYMYKIIQDKKTNRTRRYLLDSLETKSSAWIQPNETMIDKKVPGNETNYILKNLQPFTNYIILFSACNREFRGKPQCSGVFFTAERTMPNVSADIVTDVKLKILSDDEISVTWLDSLKPNGMFVAYNIEYKMADSSKSVVPDCITRTQHVQNGLIYKITDLDPGIYTLRVKPISLSGPGHYSKSIMFQLKSPLKTWVIYLFVCLVFVIVFIVVIIYLWYKKRHSLDGVHLITSINPDYESGLYIEDSWELSRDDVEMYEVLGSGSFGMVYSGYIKSKKCPCAVKTVNTSATISYRTEFLNEASIMKSFSNAHHVVKLYGVVSRGEPPLVIMELMERGDLKKYLRNSRESSQTISSREMYQMSAQIADGMSYLAAKKFVHRDLATRNCMVAGDRTVKIGDFGMTRDIYETDYYRKGTKGLLPVRWMAPESLADGIFSSESDVWGYGIILWEMVTLAEQPYQGMSNDQVLNFVCSRGRLGRPLECPDVLWEIMEACWKHKPEDRPLFLGIVEKLEPLVGPSFALVSFYHSREGREYRLNYRQLETTQASASNADPYSRHSYMSEEDDELMPQDEDFFPSNTRAFKRKSVGPSSPSWRSSYSISNPTP